MGLITTRVEYKHRHTKKKQPMPRTIAIARPKKPFSIGGNVGDIPKVFTNFSHWRNIDFQMCWIVPQNTRCHELWLVWIHEMLDISPRRPKNRKTVVITLWNDRIFEILFLHDVRSDFSFDLHITMGTKNEVTT